MLNVENIKQKNSKNDARGNAIRFMYAVCWIIDS